MPDFHVTRYVNGDFQVHPVELQRPIERPFRARFQTEMFDLGHAQGLAVRLANGKGYAFRIYRHSPPQVVAASLCILANWIEANA